MITPAMRKLEILSGMKLLPNKIGVYEAHTPRRGNLNKVWLVYEDERYWNFRMNTGIDLNGLTPYKGRLLSLASAIGKRNW